MDNNNPLNKYFRQPGVSCKLPSGGRFQPADNVRFSVTGDISVFPMRAADDMVLKNPDGLMSGMAIEQVIKSCVPDIKDPRKLPTPDLDTILLAIRAATYGNEMNIESDCPKCQYTNAFVFDVSSILDTVVPLDEEYIVRLTDEIIVHLRPFNFENSTQASLVAFQEARKVQLVDNPETSEEDRQKQLNTSYARINKMNVQMVADCVERVITPDGIVTDPKFISEFVHNIQQRWVASLESKLKEINLAGINKSHSIKCSKCDHEWTTNIEFDPASFFGQNS